MEVNLKISKSPAETERLFLGAFILIAFAALLVLGFLPKDNTVEETAAAVPETPPVQAPPPLKKHDLVIQRGQTLTDILAPFGFNPGDIYELRAQVKPVYDLAKIKAGHDLRIFTFEDGSVRFIEYDIDSEDYLRIEKFGDSYRAEIREVPFSTSVSMIWGSIEDILISAVNSQGEKDLLALGLAEIFAWDIDFYADLRRGDAFKIIFEKKYLEGEFVGYGNILAAEFINKGQSFKAFRFTYPDTGESDYFTCEGKSLRKEFMKSPFKFGTRITSRFSHSRLHPIRKVYRPHYGVDYAAPVGTPVQATADGTVTYAARNGASGRMVRIRHRNNYETMYLHLRRINVKKGDKVKNGDIIGKVGSSGESTGPHLDYRIKYGGRYINPLAHRFKPVKPLRPEYLVEFQGEARDYEMSLDAPMVLFAALSNPLRSLNAKRQLIALPPPSDEGSRK